LLKTRIANGINAGMSGIPLWGTDIGGFVPTAEYTSELYARWFQFGAFCPLFRSHGRDWRLHLPWGWNTGTIGFPEAPNYHPAEAELHNPAIEPVCRRYLELRYRLLPYLYAAARDGCDTGLPVIRGLWLHYPDDAAAAQCGDEYLFGRDLLVAPVVEPSAAVRAVYLPPRDWFNWWTKERIAGGQTITRKVDLATMPIYVCAGAVLPVGPVVQYTGEPTRKPLRLEVYPGADGAAQVYEQEKPATP
jgi:alpha-glucosidase (family GH31 glycosyl hydrolase)